MGRRQLSSYNDYARALKSGYGLGDGASYTPWIRAKDVPSRGRSTNISGIKTNRIHETLSDHESRVFYLAEFNQNISDLREQFPLIPLDIAVALANNAGLTYPTKNKGPSVLTTDFLLTFTPNSKYEFMALAVKPSAELLKRNVRERLEIERIFWVSQGIPWKLVTEKQIPITAADNLKYITKPLRGDDPGLEIVIRSFK